MEKENFVLTEYTSPCLVEEEKLKDRVKNNEIITFWAEHLKPRMIFKAKGELIEVVQFSNRAFTTNSEDLITKLRKHEGFGKAFWEGKLPDEIDRKIEYSLKDRHTHSWMQENNPEALESITQEIIEESQGA
jgi:hypothetical protein